MKFGELWRRIVHLGRAPNAADDLRDEMALHAELRARANRDAGMNESDARAAANRRFGNQLAQREVGLDVWGTAWIENIVRDCQRAFRRIGQQRAFAAAVIGMLALGVGATTAMFSVVDAAMLRPLPFADPGKLVVPVQVQLPFALGPPRPRPIGTGPIDVVELGAMRDIVSHVAVYARGGLNLADADHPLRVNVGVVSGDFFATLGVPAYRGRVIRGADAIANAPAVTILSFGLWQRQFGGAEMLGKTISLSDRSYEVVGIMPRGFGFPRESEVWIPMAVPITFETFAAFRGFLDSHVIARIADGVPGPVAAERLRAQWSRRAALDSAPAGERTGVRDALKAIGKVGALYPLRDELAGDSKTRLFVLLGATLILLLIACANVSNLLLSQAAARRQEIAVRTVLGASSRRIVGQLLIESVVLAAIGTALGVALAPALVGTMRLVLPDELTGIAPATIDLRVLLFAAALALVTAVVFGLWPALVASAVAPAQAMNAGGQRTTAGGASRVRRILVGGELALSVVLLVGALLMLRSFEQLMSVDRGMRQREVGTLEMAFPVGRGDRGIRLQRIEEMLARLRGMPGVTAVGATNDLPLGKGGGISVAMKADVGEPKGKSVFVHQMYASPGYFEVMGILLKRGRSFTVADDSLAPHVAIVSEAAGNMYWPGVNPVGHTIKLFSDTAITIVGVVSDVRDGHLSDEGAQIYYPVADQTPQHLALVARGTLGGDAILARMTDAVRAVDRRQAVFNVQMMDKVVSANVAPRRTNTILITAFGALALILAALGVYSVVSYSVSQRKREFGIRSALGASGNQLVRMVTGEMAWIVLVGLTAGMGGAWALSKVLTSLIYGVTVHDPWSFVAAPFLLLVPAIVAAVVPARRASRVNPAEVMRAD